MTFDDRRNPLHATDATQGPHTTFQPTAMVGRAAMEAVAPGIPERLEEQMIPIAPNTVRRIYEHIWGDVHQDATLGLRDRTMSAIAALTALGSVDSNLQLQISIGLNVGMSPKEIVAVIEQTAVIAGFPRAENALQVAKRVFTTTT